MMPDGDIAKVLRDADGKIDAAVKDLVDEANERGGDDNITVVLVKFEG